MAGTPGGLIFRLQEVCLRMSGSLTVRRVLEQFVPIVSQ